MAAIIVEDKEGTPWGSYDITYYRVSKSGQVSENASCDSNVSEAYVRKVAKDLQPHEALYARCQSQPGGLSAYGSERVKDAMEANEQ